MTLITKQLFINKLGFPKDINDIIKEYIFHKIKKIPINDERYLILKTIPMKEYDYYDNTIYVYLNISEEKDYFIVYKNFEIQIQILGYYEERVYFIEGTKFLIK